MIASIKQRKFGGAMKINLSLYIAIQYLRDPIIKILCDVGEEIPFFSLSQEYKNLSEKYPNILNDASMKHFMYAYGNKKMITTLTRSLATSEWTFHYNPNDVFYRCRKMLIERISIKFNEYIFDNFYGAENSYYPQIDIYSIWTHRLLIRVNKKEKDPELFKLRNIYTVKINGKTFQLLEEDMYMMVPRYFLELFEDLEPMTIEGFLKSYYDV